MAVQLEEGKACMHRGRGEEEGEHPEWRFFIRRSDALHAAGRGRGARLRGRFRLAKERKWDPVGESEKKRGEEEGEESKD